MAELNLASPTLARLYLQQGHTAKAREMLDRIVREQPGHGGALALRERLGICEGARLQAQIQIAKAKGSTSVRFKWRVFDLGHEHARLEIWLRTWTGTHGGAQSASFARIACETANGHCSAPLPSGPGSLSACIVAYAQGASEHDRANGSQGDPDNSSEPDAVAEALEGAAAIQPAPSDELSNDQVGAGLDLEDTGEQPAQILAVASSLNWA